MTIFKQLFSLTLICTAFSYCTKIDSTTIGQDLIPVVDNVNTFATDTFSITAENGIFTDTTTLLKNDDFYAGSLPSSSTFGTTNASFFIQFQPTGQFSWKAPKDSIAQMSNNGFDSAFICLGLFNSTNASGIYGDSTTPTTFNVYEIDNTSTKFKADSAYRIAVNPNIPYLPNKLGSITIAPNNIDDVKRIKLKNLVDSTTNQLRIPLNTAQGIAYGKRMLSKDTSNAFNTPATYNTEFKGFYVEAINGKSIMRFTLSANINSRLEMWYRYRKNGVIDTTADFFYYNANLFSAYVSAGTNYINRNITGSALAAASNPGIDNQIYLESTPGSFAKIRIPFIKSFPNKIIHKAELIISEIQPADPLYYSPTRLYLDAFDTASTKFLSYPYDLYLNNGTADLAAFGGFKKLVGDGLGNTISQYTFNITKNVQRMVTSNKTNYDLRLYAPYDTKFYSQRKNYYVGDADGLFNFPFVTLPIFGRVVVGGGTGSNPTYKMKLRLVYSNI